MRGNSFVAVLAAALLCAGGLAVRLRLGSEFTNLAGDGKQYVHLAESLLEHGRYAYAPPPAPLTSARLPGYPLFLAAIGRLAKPFDTARTVLWTVRVQALLDVLTALFALLVAGELGLRAPRWLALLLCLASPLLAVCVTYILTETLAILLTTATVWLLLRAGRTGGVMEMGLAGALLGLGLLVRADTVTLVPCLLVPMLLGRARLRSVLFAAAVAWLVFSPWPIRNAVQFGALTPWGAQWVNRQGEPLPTGTQEWLRTWVADPFPIVSIAWGMAYGRWVSLSDVPAYAYDSPEERRRVDRIMNDYNRSRTITPAIDQALRELATERCTRRPLDCWVRLPWQRAKRLWLDPPPEWEIPVESPTFGLPQGRAAWIPLHHHTLVLATAGFLLLLFLSRGRAFAVLVATAALVRTVAVVYLVPGGTLRYLIELYPLLLVLVAVALISPAELIWRRLSAV